MLVGELDARGSWATWGALSCAAWLADLCDIEVCTARTTAAGLFGAAIAAWSMQHEDHDVIDQRHHDARSLSWRTDPDGMVTFTLKVPPEQAGPIQAIIETELIHHDPLRSEPDAPAGASTQRTYPSLAQQRADALARLLDTSVGPGAPDSDHPSHRSVAEVVVHIRPEGNALADGTPLSDHAVGRLLPDAFVSLLMEDNRRLPIDASPRRRYPTRR